nr:hypothetical protein [uncultured Rhodopila sp.]
MKYTSYSNTSIAGLVVALVINLTILAGIIWIVVHFAKKYW